MFLEQIHDLIRKFLFRERKMSKRLPSFPSLILIIPLINEPQTNIISEGEAEAAYNELFTDTSLEIGKSISKDERDKRNLNEEKSLIYGEVEFNSFYRILRKINPEAGLTFYDLGSGTGKAVFAARFTQDFARCIGIEILQGLHNQASKISQRYNSDFRSVLCSSQRQHAAVYQGSFLEFDWTDGDVIFANSTCFDDELMESMSRMAEGLRPGAILVTFTKGINSKCFELLEKKREKMSWGPATGTLRVSQTNKQT